MKNFVIPLIIPALLILSCWNSSPSSDKAKTFKVSGSVTDKNGTGIKDVDVHITGTNFSVADTTDISGVFIFDSVKSGDYKIKAQKDTCFFKPANVEFKVNSTDIDTLRFTSADNYIHGRVLDIVNNKGIGGVRVGLFKKLEKGSTYISSIVTDSEGGSDFMIWRKALMFTGTNQIIIFSVKRIIPLRPPLSLTRRLFFVIIICLPKTFP